MAWSSAVLSADETAWAAADKPIIAASVIPVSPTVARWTEVGEITSTDRTLATAPSRYAFDGWGHLRTTPNATASSTWYYVFDLGAAYTFDAWGFYGHNFSSLALTGIYLQIADAGTFATNLQTIWTGTATWGDSRFLGLDVHHTGAVPLRYSGVRYIRIKLEKGSNFTPSLGELWLWRRRQLQFQPERPFDPGAVDTDSENTRTFGGVGMSHRRNGGRFPLSGAWNITGTTPQQDIADWHGQLNDGTRPFLWCRLPASAPLSFHIVRLPDPSLRFPFLSDKPLVRRLEIDAEEQGPEDYYLKSAVY
jgi:hypothetical protein